MVDAPRFRLVIRPSARGRESGSGAKEQAGSVGRVGYPRMQMQPPIMFPPVLGWAILALGAALFLWAFFWDRSRERLRCPKCWYDMKGLGLRCPECGHECRAERDLLRTRRRWRTSVAALMLVSLGSGLLARDVVLRHGWPALVPTSVLVFLP